ncbi:MAG: family 16 glycoside hydrolase [Planctomycetota bacterium]
MQRSRGFAWTRWVLAGLLFSSVTAYAGPVSLFDGKTLNGWKGKAEHWSVRDGAIVGSSHPKGIRGNTFLITDKQYENFILRAKFKFTGGNSGIQIRSEYVGDEAGRVLKGFQADIGEGWFGSLYDEKRRGILHKANLPWVKRFMKNGKWVDYEIRAIGNKITLKLGPLVTTRYIEKDDKIPRKGYIGLQLHGGGPMEIGFKNITIEEIQPKRILFTTHAAGFPHSSRKVAREIMKKLGRDSGYFEAVVTDGVDQITPEGLKGFDAVGFYTTGDLKKFPLSEENRNYLIQWVKDGHAFFGTHSATDTYKDWKPYWEMIGGSFAGHPWNAGSPAVTIDVEDPSHPSAQHLTNNWVIQDEIYQFRNYSRDRIHVILSLNPKEHKKGGMKHGDYPVAWCRRYGKGNVFYTSLGHREDVWTNPVYQQHLGSGILSILNIPGYEANYTPGRAKPSNDWKPLFDGKTLSGWESISEGKKKAVWEVADGVLKGSGGQGHLFSPKTYRNFHYKATARVFENSNSGMYFRAQMEKGVSWPRGMEAQVNASHGDPKRSGSLYNYEHVYAQLTKNGEWFTQEVIAIDENVVIKINGKVTVARRAPFNFKKHFPVGRFAFQQHHDGSLVEFKDVMVRELP